MFDEQVYGRMVHDLKATIAERGRQDRVMDNQHPDGEQLWTMAHDIAPDIYESWASVQRALAVDPALERIADQIDQLRQVYDGGYDAKAHSIHLAERVKTAAEACELAFWSTFAGLFPEITSGDVDPGRAAFTTTAMRQAIESLIEGNQPDGPWAAQPVDGYTIAVAARRRKLAEIPAELVEPRRAVENGAPAGWGRELWELRCTSPVVVAVPTQEDPDTEVYAQSRAEAVTILMDWDRADLDYAAVARALTLADDSHRALAEALVAAGPAHFGETTPFTGMTW